ncbi:unnamed protein product [Psylliodes chrysocephalus]|uniref:Uncharacterized protein n=1 Tax=Psylliodes chrysocephalus TaxID=3402493 RepID=A0A9P0D0Y2_9CUCU|nr:unnamed protein product [Psylliodes chrysocephala]
MEMNEKNSKVSEPLNILIPNSRIDSDIESDEEVMLPSAQIAYPVTNNLFDKTYEETLKFNTLTTVQAAYEIAVSDDEEVEIRDNEALKLQADIEEEVQITDEHNTGRSKEALNFK